MEELKEGWKSVKLEEIAIVIDSLHKTPRYSDNGYNMVRVTDVKQGKLNLNTCIKVSEEVFYEFTKKYQPKKNDIIITRVGSYGVFSYVDTDKLFCLGQNIAIINPKCNKKFLYFYLISKNIKNQIESLVVGTTQKTLSLKNINNLSINLPPLETQEKIASILSALDDKIELNNEMNKTLEEMAQTLFKRWFIDFDFPNESGEPYRSSGGKMVDSELGEIPEGWSFDNISEFFDITIGKTPPRKETQWFSKKEKDIKWASIKDLGEAGVYILNTGEKITREAIEKFNIKKVESNTVILSFKLTIGRVVITNEAMATNEAIAHFTNKNITNMTEFLYLYLKNFNYNSLGNTSSIATAVNSKIIKNIPFYLPNEKLMSKFNEIITKIFEQIRENQQEIQSLTEIRDILLPKLMSGEIEV